MTDFFAELKVRYEVQIETWPIEQGKGIDDLLFNGNKPKLLTSDAAVAYVDQLRDAQAVDKREPETKTAEPTPTAPAPRQDAMKGPDRFPYGEGEPKPFPLDFFPEPLQKVVSEISTAVNCPPDLVGSAMVSAAATAIGRSRQLEVKEDWKIGPRVYMALVCDPGSAKTPAQAKIMSPLWRKNREWEKEYDQDMEIYEVEKLAYEAQKEGIRERCCEKVQAKTRRLSPSRHGRQHRNRLVRRGRQR